MLPVRQIIPALPGFYALTVEKENGTISLFRETIIAWAFDTSEGQKPRAQAPFEKKRGDPPVMEKYLRTTLRPLTTEVCDDFEYPYILEPSGHIRTFSGCFESEEELILHLECEESRRENP